MTRLLRACCAPAALLLAACGPEVSAGDGPESGGAATVAAAPAQELSRDAAAPAVGAELALAAERSAGAPEPDAPLAEMAAVLFSDLDAEVGPRMTGVIRAINVELGDAVRAGQLLARLDDERQVARLASATAARDLARAEFNRMDGLLQNGFVTRAQHDEALYRMRMAEASLQEAEVDVEHTRIRAPFAGVVTRRMTGAGRAVEEGDPLFRITALQPLRAVARVPERDARAIRRGSHALLTGDSGVQVEAVVARISPAVDPGSGTVEVLLEVPRPGPLRPGSGAMIRFAATPAGSQ